MNLRSWSCLSLWLFLGCVSTPRVAPVPVVAAATEAAKPAAAEAPPPGPANTVYLFQGVEVVGSRLHAQAELLALIGMPKAGTTIDLSTKQFWDELAASKERLLAAHPFADCRYNLVAFPPLGTTYLTVDLVDPGDTWRLSFAPERTGDVPDPEGLLAAWAEADRQKWALRNRGELAALGEGTCRALGCVADFGHPALAALEEQFISGVPRQTDALVQVLRTDRDATKRMQAAGLLVYSTSRKATIAALVPSIRDPDHGVRNEVLRSLGALQQGQSEQLLPLEPILDALWYPTTNDRNKAGWALVHFLEAPGVAPKRLILERSGEMLAMMTGLHTSTDHEPAVKILQRLSGKTLGQDAAAWRAWLTAEGIPHRTQAP